MTSKFKDIYTHNATMLSSKREKFALQVTYAWVAELFSKFGGHKYTSKRLENFCDLNWQL